MSTTDSSDPIYVDAAERTTLIIAGEQPLVFYTVQEAKIHWNGLAAD
jgi:hypothetical protein